MSLPPTLEVNHSVSGGQPEGIVYRLESLHPDEEERKKRSIAFSPATDVAVGRDKVNCQLAFTDCPILSRVHCRIFSMGRDVFVHDFSSNGTHVNNKLMGKGNKKVLRAGDVITVVNPKVEEASAYSWRFIPPADEDDNAGASGLLGSYKLGKVLGTGNFATVKLGTSKTTATDVAVKIIEKKRFALTQSDFSFSSLQHEVEILRKMQHRNIIRIFDVYDDPATFTMVLELVRHGDLFDYIVGRAPQPFTETDARVLFIQLVEAMLYMHNKEVVHRDLKPENILVCVDPTYAIEGFCDDHQRNARNIPVNKVTLKITDFGLAKFCSEHEVMTTMCGTPSYLAPEVLVPSKTGEKKAEGYKWGVDVWSLGVILYILLSGTPPKDPQTGNITFNKYFNDISKEAKSLIVGMLRPDPRERFDLTDIVSHPWLKGCAIAGRELAKKKSTLPMEGTMLVMPSPTVISPEPTQGGGHDTDVEDSDGEVPSTRKRLRTADEVEDKSKVIIVWYWKKDLSLQDTDEKAWAPYSMEESANIEKMHQKGVRSCKIGDGTYRISFEGMFQYNKMDTSKQRPVKRAEQKVT